jgi:hypothetical protein
MATLRPIVPSHSYFKITDSASARSIGTTPHPLRFAICGRGSRKACCSRMTR